MKEAASKNIETRSPDEAMIDFMDVHKWFGDFHVLRGIKLTVGKQERIVICGPSGSGKSTLIRCINRLEEHQRGRIIVDGLELTNDIKKIEKIRAEVGMVFQHFNLFPHLGTNMGSKGPQGGGRGCGNVLSGKGTHRRTGAQVSRAALRWPATACRHCPQPLHEP